MQTRISYASKPVTPSVCPVSVADVLDVEIVPSDFVASFVKWSVPPPPEFVPVVCVPSDVKNTFPLATSEAVAVVGVVSVNFAVPDVLFGNRTLGTSEYVAPHKRID